jgi:hypothetical protein
MCRSELRAILVRLGILLRAFKCGNPGLPLPMQHGKPFARWAVRYMPQSKPWVFALPVVAVVAVLMYSSWATTAGGYIDLPRLWQTRLHQSRHLWLKDQGLIVINSSGHGRHPVVDLITSSERRWKMKLERQSTTLQDAYHEYIRRYSE